MKIDEAWNNPAVFHVNDPYVVPGSQIQTRPGALDPSIAQEEIRSFVDVSRGIDQPAAAQANGGHEG